MSASYIVGSTSAKDGAVLPHPDQPTGSGVSLPVTINSTFTTMAQVHATMANMAWREVLADSDAVIYRTGPTYAIAALGASRLNAYFPTFAHGKSRMVQEAWPSNSSARPRVGA